MIIPPPTDQTFRLWVSDDTCSFPFFADGDHARVSRKQTAINDGGPGCEDVGVPSAPKGKKASFITQVSVA